MNCLIVVDAWKHCEIDDLNKFPWLEKETKSFGSYLDLQFKLIKRKFNFEIVHCPSGREIMPEIDFSNDIVINDINEIKSSYNYYYFCGFHLGRCINKKLMQLDKNNTGVVLNLSMVFPSDSYQMALNKSQHLNNYMYSYKEGFEIIKL